MLPVGLEWIEHQGRFWLDGYFKLKEQSSAPATPSTNFVHLYAKDKAGVSTLFWKNDAGTEFDLSTALAGSGASGRIAFWSGATTLSSNSVFTWDDTNKRVGINIASPVVQLDVRGSGATVAMTLERDNGAPSISGYHVKGSATSLDNPLLFVSGGGSHSGATADRAAQALIGFYAAENWGASAKGEYITFETTPTGSTTRAERLRINANGRIRVGSSQTAALLVDVYGTGATTAVGLERDNGAPSFLGYHVKGSATSNNDLLAFFAGGGSHSGATADRAVQAIVGFYAGENWGASAKGEYITLETTPTGSSTRAERFRIGPSGQWGVGGANFGTADASIFTSGGSSAAPSWVTTATASYTPTWGGFSSAPSGGVAQWCRIGKFVFVYVNGFAAGTSNATTKTITLPVAALRAVVMAGMGHALDNGSFQNNPCRFDTRAGSTTCDVYLDLNATNWTPSGSAVFDFTLIYEAQ